MFPFFDEAGRFYSSDKQRSENGEGKKIFGNFEEFLELEKKLVFWKEEKFSFGKNEKGVENLELKKILLLKISKPQNFFIKKKLS